MSQSVRKFFKLFENFVTEAEASELVRLVDNKLRRFQYCESHFDSVISNYRECTATNFDPRFRNTNANGSDNRGNRLTFQLNGDEFAQNIVQRMRQTICHELNVYPIFSLPHILDLGINSGIKPHVDNLKSSGDIIAGLSLLSPCVIIFRDSEKPEIEAFRIVIPKNSLYIQFGDLRWKYSHEIPFTTDAKHSIDGKVIERKRRITILQRDMPKHPVSINSSYP